MQTTRLERELQYEKKLCTTEFLSVYRNAKFATRLNASAKAQLRRHLNVDVSEKCSQIKKTLNGKIKSEYAGCICLYTYIYCLEQHILLCSYMLSAIVLNCLRIL